MQKFFYSLKYFDWYLIINIILLMVFGLAALYSLQINVDRPNFVFFNKQLIFAGVGFGLFIIIGLINFKFWADYYKIIYGLMILLLASVLLFGVEIRGTTGWFNIFGQTFQPVELVKIGLIIFLAKYFSDFSKSLNLLKTIVVSGFFTALVITLVLLQPDFGSAMILFTTWLIMFFMLPIRRKTIMAILLGLLVLAVGAWLFMFQDYQKARVLNFINPQRDPLGSGYNVTQSMVAVGSGQLAGRGLALGSQSQLNFLPEQETDFIFAVIAEELGFVGAGLLLLLFLSLLIKIYLIGRASHDSFAGFFCLGLVAFLTIQLFINIGMNMGMAPVAGIPLPLISYGGSSLFSVLIALGVVLNIKIRNKSSMFGAERFE